MKKILFLLAMPILGLHAQDLHHQMLSAQGSSTVLPNGIFVSQSIGQQSVIGNSTKEGVTYGQGFQQSVWFKYINNNYGNSITTTTYPNPFVSTINFQFSNPIKEPISIAIFDIRGRMIFSQEKRAIENILTIELPQLASSNYLVQLTAANYTYYTQILKQE
jgi:hypothetical protein